MTRSPLPAWYRRDKFGLFIHWGICSVLGRGVQPLYREHRKPSEYRALAGRFLPTQYDPHAWAMVAWPWARERIWTGALASTQRHSRRVAARLVGWSRT